MDQSPVRSIEMRDCKIGYTNVAAIPIVALIPRPIPIIYAGIPSHSRAAVIRVPKLERQIQCVYLITDRKQQPKPKDSMM